LIVREPSVLDSRATSVRCTAKGKEIIHKAIVAIENADEDFFACLTKKQLDAYKSLILRIITGNDA